MILSLAVATTKICIYIAAVLILFEFLGVFWLIDIVFDIKNKNKSKKECSKRARRCFRYLRKITTMLLAVLIVGGAAFMDVTSGDREEEIKQEVTIHAVTKTIQYPYI